jgi:glycerophosphoryl diester phosphodiesterase
MGTDAVELDVFLLKCGTLVVFHGGDMLDYCGRQGDFSDLTYEQALELQFNPNFAEFVCPSDITSKVKIPTLEQVLMDAKKSGLHVKIEFKGEGPEEPSLEVVERLDMIEQCSFSSFDLSRLAHLRRLRPDRNVYKTGALFDDIPQDYLQQAEQAGATEIHLRYDTCTPQIIFAIHEAGFGSMAWFRGPIGMTKDCLEKYWDVGNEDESMYDALLRTGVQQMCINKPDVLIGLRKKLNDPLEIDPCLFEDEPSVA